MVGDFHITAAHLCICKKITVGAIQLQLSDPEDYVLVGVVGGARNALAGDGGGVGVTVRQPRPLHHHNNMKS